MDLFFCITLKDTSDCSRSAPKAGRDMRCHTALHSDRTRSKEAGDALHRTHTNNVRTVRAARDDDKYKMEKADFGKESSRTTNSSKYSF